MQIHVPSCKTNAVCTIVNHQSFILFNNLFKEHLWQYMSTERKETGHWGGPPGGEEEQWWFEERHREQQQET